MERSGAYSFLGLTKASNDETLKLLQEREELQRQAPRPWQIGDVYAPHDLSAAEMRKWSKLKSSNRDEFDLVGINPLDHYKVCFGCGHSLAFFFFFGCTGRIKVAGVLLDAGNVSRQDVGGSPYQQLWLIGFLAFSKSERVELCADLTAQNFSMISEYMTDQGRIKHSRLTGLRPVNQRKIAKAIRRAIGMGIHPSTHKHPDILFPNAFSGPRYQTQAPAQEAAKKPAVKSE